MVIVYKAKPKVFLKWEKKFTCDIKKEVDTWSTSFLAISKMRAIMQYQLLLFELYSYTSPGPIKCPLPSASNLKAPVFVLTMVFSARAPFLAS